MSASEPDRMPGVPSPTPPRRVLVIDDHEDFRQALCILLMVHGHDVEEAEDGRRGLDKLRAAKPDVALVDLGLPGLDGYAIARAARACSDTVNVRLIALTGYARPEDRRRALEAGFDAHLVKPVDDEALLRAMAGVASPESW